MLEFYADQTGTDRFSILGGPIVDSNDLGAIRQDFMNFKTSQGLKASSPIKTAGWKDDKRYRAMQKHPDVPELLTECCRFIAAREDIKLLACVVDIRERKLDQDQTDYFLIQNTAKRLQFEVQDRLGEYPGGPVSKWYVAQRPRIKKGVKGRMIVDHPGSKKERLWASHYSKVWKMAARPFTHLLHLDSSLAFEHTLHCEMLQFADIVVGVIRSYLQGGPDERFNILIPRFRVPLHGNIIDGYGLVFDPKPGVLWKKFREDHPKL